MLMWNIGTEDPGFKEMKEKEWERDREMGRRSGSKRRRVGVGG